MTPNPARPLRVRAESPQPHCVSGALRFFVVSRFVGRVLGNSMYYSASVSLRAARRRASTVLTISVTLRSFAPQNTS